MEMADAEARRTAASVAALILIATGFMVTILQHRSFRGSAAAVTIAYASLVTGLFFTMGDTWLKKLYLTSVGILGLAFTLYAVN